MRKIGRLVVDAIIVFAYFGLPFVLPMALYFGYRGQWYTRQLFFAYGPPLPVAVIGTVDVNTWRPSGEKQLNCSLIAT
jgi:hypothetical protein